MNKLVFLLVLLVCLESIIGQKAIRWEPKFSQFVIHNRKRWSMIDGGIAALACYGTTNGH